MVQHTDSFSEVWAEIGGSLGCDVATDRAASDVSPAQAPAAVILAVGGAETAAFDLIAELVEAGNAAVAVVGSDPDHRLASGLLRAGADDYFALPGDLGSLHAWVEDRADRARATLRARDLAAAERTRYDFSRMIGESGGLKAALQRASRVIPRGRATVLITGETGTGKELLAQAIHYNGPRASEPFVEVNCTALPESLLEAELFGYERGAFTDAHTSKPGLFEAAHGGSLFLDEIGDLAPTVQAKLLKVLEDKRVRRIGSLKTQEVDVRIIAATHVDLASSVRGGTFREDLYYRLNVLPIHLPPLRDRGDDLLLLADHFVAQAGVEYEMDGLGLDPGVRKALLAHHWPGNIRELKNAIHRAVLLGDGSLGADELFVASPSPAVGGAIPFPASLKDIELAAAQAALEATGGNKRAAASMLGISRTRLYRLLERGADEGV